MEGLATGSAELKLVGYEHSAFGADCGFSILALKPAAQVNDVPAEAIIARDSYDQPFHSDRLISEDRPAEFDPVFETNHRHAFRKMRCSESKKKSRGLRSAGDKSAIPCLRSECGVEVDWIAVPCCPGVLSDISGIECDF
jgi:hypothetical protein